jgi:hypothetical protein
MSSGVLPFTLFCTTTALWMITVWYSHRLGHRFCERFPLVAQREIPYAFDRGLAHPEKAMFFFRRKAGEAMRDDPALCRQRKVFITLSILSLAVPVAGFLPMFVYAAIMSQR